MILDDVRREESGAQVELSVRMRTGDEDRRLWFRLPASGAEPLPLDASPFVPATLLMAMRSGEPLTVDAPVSRRLLEGLDDVMSLCRSFWPGELATVAVDAAAAVSTAAARPGETGCFFTRGVDSWHSVLSAGEPERDPPERLSRLVHLPDMKSYDGPLRETDVEQTRRAAAAVGYELMILETNAVVLARRWRRLFGPVMAGAALAVGFERFLIPSGTMRGELIPWSSHPELDRRFSTEATEVLHHGDATRLEKMATLARSPVALETLMVCGRPKSDRNCGECEKCLHTMTEMQAVGALEASDRFDRPLDPARLAAVEGVVNRRQWRAISRALGDTDFDRRLAAALELSIYRADVRTAIETSKGLRDERGLAELDPGLARAVTESRPGLVAALRAVDGFADAVPPPRRDERALRRAGRRAEARLGRANARLARMEGSRWWRLGRRLGAVAGVLAGALGRVRRR